MPVRVTTETAKKGAAANDRRVLEGVTTTTSVPTTQAHGVSTNRSSFLHLLFKLTGTNPVFSVRVWWYSTVSGSWHKGELLAVNADDIVTVETQGLERVALQITAVSGTGATMNGWVALVKESAS